MEERGKLIQLVPPTKPTVNDNCVKTVETLLEMAKSGEVVQVAIAAAGPDGQTTTAWPHGVWNTSLLAAVARLMHRLAG